MSALGQKRTNSPEPKTSFCPLLSESGQTRMRLLSGHRRRSFGNLLAFQFG